MAMESVRSGVLNVCTLSPLSDRSLCVGGTLAMIPLGKGKEKKNPISVLRNQVNRELNKNLFFGPFLLRKNELEDNHKASQTMERNAKFPSFAGSKFEKGFKLIIPSRIDPTKELKGKATPYRSSLDHWNWQHRVQLPQNTRISVRVK